LCRIQPHNCCKVCIRRWRRPLAAVVAYCRCLCCTFKWCHAVALFNRDSFTSGWCLCRCPGCDTVNSITQQVVNRLSRNFERGYAMASGTIDTSLAVNRIHDFFTDAWTRSTSHVLLVIYEMIDAFADFLKTIWELCIVVVVIVSYAQLFIQK